jgi:hypothetical protein
MMANVSPALAASESGCRVCRCPITPEEPTHVCAACGTAVHQECRDYVGGCAVYGCPAMYETKKADGEDVTYWGVAEKTCAMCGETIAMSALECPFCHATFTDIRPQSREEILQPAAAPPPTPLRRTAVTMLVLSLAGITSPLVLLFGGVWYLRKRREIAAEGPTTRALALVALAICVVYGLFIAAGALIFQLGGSEGGLP